MSQHIVLHTHSDRKYVFGWDQPMLTFFLQVHDLTRSEDHQIINWQVDMYEVEELVKVARERGLEIPYETQVKLYAEKDDGI